MKILTTALMLIFILQKPLSKIQWIALVVLVVGVSGKQRRGKRHTVREALRAA